MRNTNISLNLKIQYFCSFHLYEKKYFAFVLLLFLVFQGGLPPWLLTEDPDMRLRSSDPSKLDLQFLWLDLTIKNNYIFNTRKTINVILTLDTF